MSKTPNLRVIPLSEIRTNPVALREVDRDGEAYQSLCTDIGKRGVLLPITVVEKIDEATSECYFQIVDGLHRYSGACDNDLPDIPANVLDIDDADVVETQIVANLVKVDTKPVEYTKALQRMMNMNPTMTVGELADRISQSPTFVMQRFSLLKLDDPIQKLVDEGEIKLANAYALSKLPKEHQHEWTDAAMAQQPGEFVPAVNARVKELKEAAREGRAAGTATYEPTARLRKLSELKPEHDNPETGPALCAEFNCKTAAEGFALGLAWVLNLDPHSVEAGKAKWEAQRKAREEEKRRRAAIRETRRQQEAAEKAAKAREESGLSDEEIEAALAREAQEKAAAETEAEVATAA